MITRAIAKQRGTKTEYIRAAGGLVWRRAKSRYEIIVIRRERYNDWTLPKGKLDPGETWEQAAIREVREETGFRTKILSFAGAVAYPTDKGPKLVRFWHMLTSGPAQARHDHEVAEVLWLPVPAARERLDYELERALLEAWDRPPSRT